MLFAMDAGSRVVGVGSYDRFPPQVEGIPRVGGLVDPNTEQILGLKPDLVIVYATQTSLIDQLGRANIPTFIYEHRALGDIMHTVRALGTRIGAGPAAEQLATRMEQALADVRAAVADRPRPRTLLVFGRDPGTLRNINASGGYGFLADLLDVAGGTNVFADIPRQSVQTSTEMVLTLAPEVIIELRYGDASATRDEGVEIAAWNVLPSVPAVRNNRVHVLTGDEFVVPGPRITEAATKLRDALHGAP
jgi:iron complex transport system substrate-binding protein